MTDVRMVSVFPDGPGGGNPAPVVLAASDLSDAEMQDVARTTGHESAFVVNAAGTGCDLALRFWVPNHEMSMCGHATVGTLWLLTALGRLRSPSELRVHTASGIVHARIDGAGRVSISQPAARVEVVPDDSEVLDVLGLCRADLADRPVRNATTSRTKTLVPVRDVSVLDALTPGLDRVDTACAAIGSTGLYPYAVSGERQVDARQFPRSSGYPEDAATGIAAAALSFGLLADGLVDADDRPITVRQGRAMGRPARMTVRFDVRNGRAEGCWLGGPVRLIETPVET